MKNKSIKKSLQKNTITRRSNQTSSIKFELLEPTLARTSINSLVISSANLCDLCRSKWMVYSLIMFWNFRGVEEGLENWENAFWESDSTRKEITLAPSLTSTLTPLLPIRGMWEIVQEICVSKFLTIFLIMFKNLQNAKNLFLNHDTILIKTDSIENDEEGVPEDIFWYFSHINIFFFLYLLIRY